MSSVFPRFFWRQAPRRQGWRRQITDLKKKKTKAQPKNAHSQPLYNKSKTVVNAVNATNQDFILYFLLKQVNHRVRVDKSAGKSPF